MSALLDHLGLSHKHQYHGFRRGHSTVHVVGQLNNFVLVPWHGGKVTGMLFLDISKASDSVNHKILLDKLQPKGLSVRSLRWFKSYLSNRQQCAYINVSDTGYRPWFATGKYLRTTSIQRASKHQRDLASRLQPTSNGRLLLVVKARKLSYSSLFLCFQYLLHSCG